MSYCRINIVHKNGDVLPSDYEWSNGWGFAPLIWDALATEYRSYLPTPLSGHRGDTEWWRVLWPMARSLPLAPFEWNCLHLGYDRAVVRFNDLPAVAESLREFWREHPTPGDYTNHLREIAGALDEICEKGGVLGVAFYPFSVAGDLWQKYDYDLDEARPYNVNTDTGHFFIEVR